MKTSVMAVHDLLCQLTVDEVEARIGKVTGAESATKNFAARNAAVRYDETLLDVAESKPLHPPQASAGNQARLSLASYTVSHAP